MTSCPEYGIRFTPTPHNPTYCKPACWPSALAEREAARASAAKPIPTPTAKAKRRHRLGQFVTLNAFVDFGIADTRLTLPETIVWFVLFRDMKGDGTARTGQTDIVRHIGLDVRTVRLAIASLEAKGILQTLHRGRLNTGPSTYRVHPTGTA